MFSCPPVITLLSASILYKLIVITAIMYLLAVFISINLAKYKGVSKQNKLNDDTIFTLIFDLGLTA